MPTHELGHLVLHRHGGPHRGGAAEFEARLFAASMLIPEPVVRAKIPRALLLNHIVAAERRWSVSASALACRSNKLGIMSDRVYRGIVVEIGRRGHRTEEPNRLPHEESILWHSVLVEL